MRWYKHISESLDNPIISDIMDEHGALGYLVFFGVLEIYARRYSKDVGWKLDVSLKYIRGKLRIVHNKSLVNVLKTIHNVAGWDVVFHGDRVTIKVDKFHELADNWSSRKPRKHTPPDYVDTTEQLPDQKEEEVDGEEEGKDIYTLIFAYWNSEAIIVHQKLTDKCKTKIRAALKDHDEAEIMAAINNYATVFNGADYYWSHKWTLGDFLSRGLEKFMDSATPLENFHINQGGGNGQQNSSGSGKYYPNPRERPPGDPGEAQIEIIE